MTDEYLFFSDCHLDANRQDISQNLVEFLKSRAAKARFLYILGDLFEAWVGDDDPASELEQIFQCFRDISNNTRIFFLAGNRDFLFKHKGAQRMGAQIIDEPTLLTLGNQKVALLHGDSMCTDDPEYQQFRKMVRGESWQADFMAKPLLERKQIAIGLREQSKAAMQHKSMDIMDVNRDAVLSAFCKLGIDTIIHGHTHQPAIHQYTDNQIRYVLGDWNPLPSFLSWRADIGFELNDYRV